MRSRWRSKVGDLHLGSGYDACAWAVRLFHPRSTSYDESLQPLFKFSQASPSLLSYHNVGKFTDNSGAIDVETSENFDLYTTISRSADSVQQTEDDEEIFVELEEDTRLAEIFEQANQSIAQLDEVYQSKTLTTNIHPIGRLVVGHKFERAVLYKVLADALGVRCWLRRGTGQTASIAWVEVNVEPPNSKNPQQAEELKPNHLIDLMSAEPRLLPIGSKEARQYTKLLD
ncbi:unnamed protein product [Nesidiocoris tenuis]|uniref:EDR1/CTR1/ARMC3-like peptidase-like domain-containing protein n=1 Tax=Nesidiocoris tenuis TaxID=355587 RepID=A0A6H5FW92_9HEMI|nr:unnamed protein product [Nesidiocoris tenuis]